MAKSITILKWKIVPMWGRIRLSETRFSPLGKGERERPEDGEQAAQGAEKGKQNAATMCRARRGTCNPEVHSRHSCDRFSVNAFTDAGKLIGSLKERPLPDMLLMDWHTPLDRRRKMLSAC